MDFILALCLAIPTGLAVYFFLRWLEPRLEVGAEARQTAADERQRQTYRNERSERNKDLMSQALARKANR